MREASFSDYHCSTFSMVPVFCVIVTARRQNLSALSDAGPTTCRLVASFNAQGLKNDASRTSGW